MPRLNFICFWTWCQIRPESPNYKSDVVHRDKGNESWREKRRETGTGGKEKKKEKRNECISISPVPGHAAGVSGNFRYFGFVRLTEFFEAGYKERTIVRWVCTFLQSDSDRASCLKLEKRAIFGFNEAILKTNDIVILKTTEVLHAVASLSLQSSQST